MPTHRSTHSTSTALRTLLEASSALGQPRLHLPAWKLRAGLMGTLLDACQLYAKREILAGHNVLITGPAGTGETRCVSQKTVKIDAQQPVTLLGKSTLMRDVINGLQERHRKFGLTAMTGCAAEGISGVTLHSLLGRKSMPIQSPSIHARIHHTL